MAERDPRIECGEGWDSIVLPLIEMCNRHNVAIHQIKEKFGGLRFYVGDAPQEVYDAIEFAERRSFGVCEFCGGAGKRIPTFRGWIKTQCEPCSGRQ